jgi:hypothetical protein
VHRAAGSAARLPCDGCGSVAYREAIFRSGITLCASCVRTAKVPPKQQTLNLAQAGQPEGGSHGQA